MERKIPLLFDTLFCYFLVNEGVGGGLVSLGGTIKVTSNMGLLRSGSTFSPSLEPGKPFVGSDVGVLSHERVTGSRILRTWTLRGRQSVKWETKQQ